MHQLKTIDLNGFDTRIVTDMRSMFDRCYNLTTLDISSFVTSNVTDMRNMFLGNGLLTTIYCGSDWTTDKVTNSQSMFEDCTNLVGGKGTKYDAAHTDKEYAHADGGTSNPGYLTLKGGPLLGDVNGDGNVNSADVQKVYQLMAQGATGVNHPEADVNGDGNVNSADIQKIYSIMAMKLRVMSEE